MSTILVVDNSDATVKLVRSLIDAEIDEKFHPEFTYERRFDFEKTNNYDLVISELSDVITDMPFMVMREQFNGTPIIGLTNSYDQITRETADKYNLTALIAKDDTKYAILRECITTLLSGGQLAETPLVMPRRAVEECRPPAQRVFSGPHYLNNY